MDKTLEIVMVAVALIVAAVIVVGLLQGQVDMFGGFASDQTNSSGCGIAKTQFCNAQSSGSLNSRAAGVYNDNLGCSWTGSSTVSGSGSHTVNC